MNRKLIVPIFIGLALLTCWLSSKESKATQSCRIYAWALRYEVNRCFSNEVVVGFENQNLICAKLDVTCPGH